MALKKTAPDDFDQFGKDIWNAVKRELQAQNNWKATDSLLLERYCRAEMEARRIRAERGDLRTAEGSKGQTTVHPLVKMEREASLDAQKYAESLGLTPETRKRNQQNAGAGAGGQRPSKSLSGDL